VGNGYIRVIKDNYTIDEILNAVNELQNQNGLNKNLIKNKKIKELDRSDIPINTLKLIEEAERIVKSKLRSE